MRHLFAAIEAGIRTTAPRSAMRGLLATLRDQQRGTEREIIERGKRRRQQHHELQRVAQADEAAAPKIAKPDLRHP